MKEKPRIAHRKANVDTQEEQLYVTDIVQYLSNLAKLNGEEKTGNIAFSQGLQDLVRILRPFAECTVSELSDVLKERSNARTTNARTAKKARDQFTMLLPASIETMAQNDVLQILDDESCTKQQIIDLGVRRFGISQSKLQRLRKEDARATVRAALAHERSLDVIATEASKGVL